MFDAKKLLDQFLGSQMPGLGGSVRDRAGDAVQTAKNNPLATGAIAAVLLGTKTGRGRRPQPPRMRPRPTIRFSCRRPPNPVSDRHPLPAAMNSCWC